MPRYPKILPVHDMFNGWSQDPKWGTYDQLDILVAKRRSEKACCKCMGTSDDSKAAIERLRKEIIAELEKE